MEPNAQKAYARGGLNAKSLPTICNSYLNVGLAKGCIRGHEDVRGADLRSCGRLRKGFIREHEGVCRADLRNGILYLYRHLTPPARHGIIQRYALGCEVAKYAEFSTTYKSNFPLFGPGCVKNPTLPNITRVR